VDKESEHEYGLFPPPINADKGMSILIEHFLGKDWYVTSPMGTEQVYTEAIHEILKRNQKRKSLFSRLFSR
jgi:hypothetical protein